MKTCKLICLAAILLVIQPAFSQRLNPFTSHLESVDNSGTTEYVPYKRTLSYFDCIDVNVKPDTLIARLPSYLVEFELPSEVKEIGIRFISPVPENYFPNTGDIVTEIYSTQSKDKAWFDPMIVLEQWTTDTTTSSSKWIVLGENNNADDAPAQPDGNKNNSVLRVTKGSYPITKYRVRIQSTNKNTPKGCYLLQIGTVPGIKGIVFQNSN